MKSHQGVSQRQEAQAERALLNAVLTVRTVDECRAFFRDLCTPAELQALADRWAVVGLLQEGLPYREIHKLTGVSVTTIGRVARYLAAGNGGYRLAADRLKGTADRSRSERSPQTLSPADGRQAAMDKSRHG